MIILGVDYGRKKIGLAISEGKIAQPYKVIRVNNFEEAVKKVLQTAQMLQANKIVVGVSEGKMGEESKKFARKMNADISSEILSTYDAQELSKQAGINRKKRKEMEDAFAAAIMLQNHLDGL